MIKIFILFWPGALAAGYSCSPFSNKNSYMSCEKPKPIDRFRERVYPSYCRANGRCLSNPLDNHLVHIAPSELFFR
jgi:hypothetical protein